MKVCFLDTQILCWHAIGIVRVCSLAANGVLISNVKLVVRNSCEAEICDIYFHCFSHS